MVKNSSRLKEFEDDYIRRNKPDMLSNLQLLDSLYEEAKALSVFPLQELLSGLEIDIKIAKVINSVPKTSWTYRRRALVTKHSLYDHRGSSPEKWLAEFDASLNGNYLELFKKIQDGLNKWIEIILEWSSLCKGLAFDLTSYFWIKQPPSDQTERRRNTQENNAVNQDNDVIGRLM